MKINATALQTLIGKTVAKAIKNKIMVSGKDRYKIHRIWTHLSPNKEDEMSGVLKIKVDLHNVKDSVDTRQVEVFFDQFLRPDAGMEIKLNLED